MARMTRDFAESLGRDRRHNISQVNGKAEVFTAGESPWHNLGVNVQSAQTWEQAIQLANLDWTIRKEQLQSQSGTAVDAYGLFRNDNNTFLHTAGKRYTPIQNSDAFKFLDTLTGTKNGLSFVSAGALGKGETIWCCTNLVNSEICIKGTDDKMIPYLVFTENRDGKAAWVKYSLTRVVCQNTLRASYFDGNRIFRLPHTAGVVDKMEKASIILTGLKAQCKTLEDKMNFLAGRKATTKVMKNVLTKLFPKIEDNTAQQNKARVILERYEDNDGNTFPSERGSVFNLLNAITGYVDHDRSVRINGFDVNVPDECKFDVNLAQKPSEKFIRTESALFGTGDAFKAQAFEYILEAADTAPSIHLKAIDSILDKVAI